MQAARADVLGALVDRPGDLGDAADAVRRELDGDAFRGEERDVLRAERGIGLGKYAFEVADRQRVELNSLGVDDFVRILTEPDASLTAQYKALMGTENVDVKFAQDGVRRLAEIAFSVNEKTENIGARRLHTVMERLLESVSFDAAEKGGSAIEIDAGYVEQHLGNLAKDEDLSRYIL